MHAAAQLQYIKGAKHFCHSQTRGPLSPETPCWKRRMIRAPINVHANLPMGKANKVELRKMKTISTVKL